MKPKICAIWSFMEKVSDPWSIGIIEYEDWKVCLKSYLLMGKQKHSRDLVELVSSRTQITCGG